MISSVIMIILSIIFLILGFGTTDSKDNFKSTSFLLLSILFSLLGAGNHIGLINLDKEVKNKPIECRCTNLKEDCSGPKIEKK